MLSLAVLTVYWPIFSSLHPRIAATWTRDKVVPAVLSWRHPVAFLEVPYEVAFIGEANAHHDLLNSEKGSSQECRSILHPQRPEITCWWSSDFGFEQKAQSRRRKVH